jgi:hypothetical protein
MTGGVVVVTAWRYSATNTKITWYYLRKTSPQPYHAHDPGLALVPVNVNDVNKSQESGKVIPLRVYVARAQRSVVLRQRDAERNRHATHGRLSSPDAALKDARAD